MSAKKREQDEDIVLEPAEEETGEENLRLKLKNLKDKLAECAKERTEYLSGWQRAKADYINLEKESSGQAKRMQNMAVEGIIHEIIPVMDSFEMAMSNKEAWASVQEGWRKGVEYIYGQLKGVLSDHGVAEICPKEKDEVDFEYHAVVNTVQPEKDGDKGRISAVLQKGYTQNGKVLRPARITVFSDK